MIIMLKVNYKLLQGNQRKKKSIGVKSLHNSFYIRESHFEPNLTESHGIFVDDLFGFKFSSEDNDYTSKQRWTDELCK